MGQEPAELRRDIERRREELGETIDAIGDRVSPGRIIERRRNRMADGLRSFKERVMGSVDGGSSAMGGAVDSVRDHVGPDAIKAQTAGSPLGAGVVAFGVGFIVAAALPPSRVEVAATERAQDSLEPAKDALVDAARNVASDVKEGAVEAAQEVKGTATDAASQVSDTAGQQAAAARDDVRDQVSN